MKLSIATSLYRSEEFLDEFVTRAVAAAEEFGGPFEIILVDDGSPDESLAKALGLAVKDSRITVVQLARNFGHHAALLAALEHTTGDYVFLVDSDLEEPPELLNAFHKTLDAENADVVFGRHSQTTGSVARQVTSGAFWKLYNFLSDTKVEPNLCHVRLMKRSYVDALLALQERNLFLGGMYAWAGHKQIAVDVDRKLRRHQSTYSPWARIALFANSLTAFSSRPLILVFLVGVAISAGALLIATYFLVRKLIAPETIVSGFAMIAVSIMLFSGIIILSQGIIGIYIARIFNEVKGRPRHIVKQVWRAAPSAKAARTKTDDEVVGS